MSTMSHAWRHALRQSLRRKHDHDHRSGFGWLIWLLILPFRLVFGLVGFILGLVGRLVGFILGLVLILAGGLISLTIIGAIIGIPLALLGLLLVVMALF